MLSFEITTKKTMYYIDAVGLVRLGLCTCKYYGTKIKLKIYQLLISNQLKQQRYHFSALIVGLLLYKCYKNYNIFYSKCTMYSL